MPYRSIRPHERAVIADTVHGRSQPKARWPWSALLIALTMLLAALVALLAVQDVADGADTCDKYAAPGSGSAQNLVDSLSSGQVGCLRGGTYTDGDGTLTLKKAGITLQSAPNELATLKARIYLPEGVNQVTVDGLRIEGTPGKANVLVRANYTKLLNNEVTNGHRPESCVLVGSNSNGQATATGTEIRGNFIHNCGELPRTNLNHGIYVSDSRDAKIVDNLIYDNADRGVQLYPDAQNTLVEGNVINNNGQGMVFDGSSSNNTVRGNVISYPVVSYNVYAPRAAYGSGNLVESNCLWTPGGSSGVNPNAAVFTARSNVVANPNFSGGLKLGATSSCRSVYLGTLAK